MSESGERFGFKGRIWIVLVVVPIILIMLAAFRWSLDHPYGFCWDEAKYINQSMIDAQRLVTGNLVTLGGRILINCDGRPPAYRILSLPFLVLLGSHPASVRLLSVVCFGLSSAFVYLATRRIGSPVAGAFAVLVFALSPEVVGASKWYSTEGPLYLATSAMLYYLFVSWTASTEDHRNWIGLGLAVGLGFLSKASFLVIALPALAFWSGVNRWGRPAFSSVISQRKAGLLALVVAGPWWVLNIKSLAPAVQDARGFAADSLGPPSLATYMKWLDTVIQCLVGHWVSILILLVAIAWLRKAIVKRETILDPLQRAALGVCASAGVPIVVTQLAGTNHLLRHLSPAVIPLAISVGVLSDKTGWARSKAALTISSLLFGAQFLMIIAPVLVPNTQPVAVGFVNSWLPWRVMSRRDQWDWRPLYNLARNCGLEVPKISYMGFGPGLTQPNLEYPWAVQGASTHDAKIVWPDVKWLWRVEQGPVKWQEVMDDAAENDIVLTLPHYVGIEEEEKRDNQHNFEFVNRLSRDPRFQGPIRLEVGRFAPIEVAVFLKKSLVYHFGQKAVVSP